MEDGKLPAPEYVFADVVQFAVNIRFVVQLFQRVQYTSRWFVVLLQYPRKISAH